MGSVFELVFKKYRIRCTEPFLNKSFELDNSSFYNFYLRNQKTWKTKRTFFKELLLQMFFSVRDGWTFFWNNVPTSGFSFLASWLGALKLAIIVIHRVGGEKQVRNFVGTQISDFRVWQNYSAIASPPPPLHKFYPFWPCKKISTLTQEFLFEFDKNFSTRRRIYFTKISLSSTINILNSSHTYLFKRTQ